jgi:AcrR family transcriptional regulator
VQRERLFQAAARVFAKSGYAEATAEAISREAGMSKATFYEHFANKEECLLALFDEAAKLVLGQMNEASEATFPTYKARVENGVRLFLETLTTFPEAAQTLLVQVVAAGPSAAERRDRVMEEFATFLERDNRRHGDRYFASRDDAYAIVGAIVELVTRQMRTGTPADVRELEPVIERLIFGLLTVER